MALAREGENHRKSQALLLLLVQRGGIFFSPAMFVSKKTITCAIIMVRNKRQKDKKTKNKIIESSCFFWGGANWCYLKAHFLEREKMTSWCLILCIFDCEGEYWYRTVDYSPLVPGTRWKKVPGLLLLPGLMTTLNTHWLSLTDHFHQTWFFFVFQPSLMWWLLQADSGFGFFNLILRAIFMKVGLGE